MNKTLIAYFSATGVTRNIAIKMSEILNSDIEEIEPKSIYTNEDLDWTKEDSRSSIEMKDIYNRPELKNNIDITNYDTIIIGFPIWWYKAPNIIKTFIENNDLSNKKIYIFATSGSSSIDSTLNDLKNNYPSLNIISGKRLNTINYDEVLDWVK